jgi:5-methyltetrahydropteroyltriglutamate--homocysteine methyltransferase
MPVPYRADQVGSLLRPAALKEAHEKFLKGNMSSSELRVLQDEAIIKVIKFQENTGLHAITDGELRRTSFSSDFIETLEGAKSPGYFAMQGRKTEIKPSEQKESSFTPRAFNVISRLRHTRPIEVDNFKFVKSHTTRTAKQAIPSPTMLLRGGRDAVSREAYTDLAEFHADIAQVYTQELQALGAAGCNYVQLDDTNYAYLCDPTYHAVFTEWGYGLDEMRALSARVINAAIAQRPANMVAGIHICRGNSAGRWAAQGGYEPIAETLLNELQVDAYFLEFDDARSGGFEPLRFFPKGSRKRVVLGLVSTKSPAIESKDELKRRIEAATKFVPLENLCLSPQCGFSSTYVGNPITENIQRRKLELVVETATEVWGTAA